MVVRDCPKCGKKSLRINNVMCSTEEIHWNCGDCCYKEITDYNYKFKRNK